MHPDPDPATRERLERSKREWMARRAAAAATTAAVPPEPGTATVAAKPRVPAVVTMPAKPDMHTAAAVAPTLSQNRPSVLENTASCRSRHNAPPGTQRNDPSQARRAAQPHATRAARRPGRGTSVVAGATPEWRSPTFASRRPASSLQPDHTLSRLQVLHEDLSKALSYHNAGGTSVEKIGLRRLDGPEKEQWAFEDETDVSDFHAHIPDPAMTFPFELDDFQKRAIFHVEARENVFVAAHTSAGKTVVAEYAIALAARLGLKVFYTSPIKTLSNQKLRDFRSKFESVGLVTGDVSINENAQCVIMTTEILRSMLYRGADVIRDLMFVIFDEVQFLNDEERGVVWEESIIMLPPNVSVVMLSATVPNALEFASWVGKTRDRKVGVVSTTKRPVPLRHAWLHRNPDTPEELCESVLLEQGGRFLSKNFKSALRAASAPRRDAAEEGKGDSKGDRKSEKKRKRSRRGKAFVERIVNKEDTAAVDDKTDSQEASKLISTDVCGNEVADTLDSGLRNRSGETSILDPPEPEEEASICAEGSSVPRPTTREALIKGVNKNKGHSGKREAAAGGDVGGGPNVKRTPWAPLVRFLHERDRTPAVIFCFSKKKCESSVDSLENIDLLPDAGQKAHVHRFFDESMCKLREEDRNLPQVIRVRSNLKRGISAHHAGLLPLIKEVTEILFSQGLVKILFATETFAMGVNMPARTVVFAAVRKHDGRKRRFLEAGEYTQMSGRAGRRGLDKVGHVYIFFPPDERYPQERDLEKVMTGQPISLRSAFRLTYNMILNVLRVDELRVEEMMKKSFSEAGENSRNESIEAVLKSAHGTMESLNVTDPAKRPELRGGHLGYYAQGSIHAYVDTFCEVVALSEKLSSQDLNRMFMDTIVPGRVVVAEVQGGWFSLAVVYGVVPHKGDYSRDVRNGQYSARAAGRSTVIRDATQLWVAFVMGLVPKSQFDDAASLLLLPTLRIKGKRGGFESDHPSVVTQSGLIVSLRQIRASKIVYICDAVDTVSSKRAEDQVLATKEWHFKKVINAPKRTLLMNAAFLEGVVSAWKSGEGMDQLWEAQRFPAEVTSPHTTEAANSDSVAGRLRCRKRIKNVSPFYTARVGLVVDLITDSGLAEEMRDMNRNQMIPRIRRLVLERSILNKVASLKTASESLQTPNLLPEYEKRVKVLQTLKYIDEGLSVKLKGRCACDVSTVDSVVLTEIVAENVLNGLKPAEVASLLSSLVCRKKNVKEVHNIDPTVYSAEYRAAKAEMRRVVGMTGKVQEQCGVELDFEIADSGEDYEGSICRWDLCQAVFAWANGEAFFNITDLTEQQEGDIVVCIKRLNELLRDTQHVAKVIENTDLLEVLAETVTAIRRDVVFNGSLYYEDGTREAFVEEVE